MLVTAEPPTLPTTTIGLEEAVAAAVSGQGYARIKLDHRPRLERLRERYLAEFGRQDVGPDGELVVDYLSPQRDRLRRLSALIDPVIAELLEGQVTGYAIVLSTVVVKYPGPDSAMFLHEDRSLVDESIDRSLTLWVPLCDTGAELDNGPLALVPWSHLLGVVGSGSSTPEPFRAYEPWLRERLVTMEVALGEALIYDSRLLHASGPNRSAQPRIALVVSLVPTGSTPLHLRGLDRGRIGVHEVDREFFWDHHVRDIERSMPDRYPRVRTLPVDPPALRRSAQAAIGRMAAHLGVTPPPPRPWVPEEILEPPDQVHDWSHGTAPPPFRSLKTAAFGPTGNDSGDPILAPLGSPTPSDSPPPADSQPPSDRAARARVYPARLDGPFGLVRDAELWTVPPRSHATVTGVVTPRWRTIAHVQTSPGFGAGIARSGDPTWQVAELEETQALELPQGEPLTLWNMGPGPLEVLVVRELRPDASLLDRLYAQLLSLRAAWRSRTRPRR
jgi:hypothetical protein